MTSVRFTFAGGPGDFVITAPSTTADVVHAYPNATGTAWSQAAGGTQYTDLLAIGATPAPVATDADGFIYPFQGPLGVGILWVDFGAGQRFPLIARELVAVLGADGNVDGTKILSGVDGSAITTGTVLDARLPVTAQAATLTATYVAKGALVFNVRDYGAVGDATTDDTAAIVAAIAAADAAGSSQRYVLFPAGTYVVSSTVNVPAGVALIGQNAAISTSFASGDVFVLAATARIEGFQFVTSVTRTSGACALVNGNQCYVERCSFDGNIFVGVQIGTATTKATNARVNRIVFSNMTNSLSGAGGIYLNNVSDCRVSDITGTGVAATGQCDFGIRVSQGDTWYIVNANMVRMGRGLLIDTAAGLSTFAGRIIGGMFDSAGTGPGGAASSAEIVPAGFVYDLNVVGTWFGNSVSQAGLNVAPTGTGVVDGAQFTGCEFVHNGYSGASFTGSTVKRWKLEGGNAFGNTNYGVAAAGGTSDFTINGLHAGISGVHAGPQSIGINLAAAAQTGYIITGCNLRGNTSAAISDNTTGTPSRIVANNLLV